MYAGAARPNIKAKLRELSPVELEAVIGGTAVADSSAEALQGASTTPSTSSVSSGWVKSAEGGL
jgi:hypothetical protein